ncbi:hypothetical protein J2X36_005162 [Methylobacterium sp. BE186]|nr:hypothetical protein [Methylobacterium sp. BE186]
MIHLRQRLFILGVIVTGASAGRMLAVNDIDLAYEKCAIAGLMAIIVVQLRHLCDLMRSS